MLVLGQDDGQRAIVIGVKDMDAVSDVQRERLEEARLLEPTRSWSLPTVREQREMSLPTIADERCGMISV